ncbi:hypothetical protein EB151_11720, partial [archaeon]|nr:hypothetical protein [archaeon]
MSYDPCGEWDISTSSTPSSNGDAEVSSDPTIAAVLTFIRLYKVDNNSTDKSEMLDYAMSVGQGSVTITWNNNNVTYYNYDNITYNSGGQYYEIDITVTSGAVAGSTGVASVCVYAGLAHGTSGSSGSSGTSGTSGSSGSSGTSGISSRSGTWKRSSSTPSATQIRYQIPLGNSLVTIDIHKTSTDNGNNHNWYKVFEMLSKGWCALITFRNLTDENEYLVYRVNPGAWWLSGGTGDVFTSRLELLVDENNATNWIPAVGEEHSIEFDLYRCEPLNYELKGFDGTSGVATGGTPTEGEVLLIGYEGSSGTSGQIYTASSSQLKISQYGLSHNTAEANI